MNKKLNLIIILGLLVVVLVVAGVAYDYLSKGASPVGLTVLTPTETTAASETTSSTAQTEDTQTDLAPDFTVYDLDGNAHKLSDFRGKPVVLNFWASWCGPCKSEMPDFDEVYGQYGQDIHFVMVNLTDGYQETVESASSFIADSGYSFPVYYDTDVDAAMQYGVTAVPVTYFIDAEGCLVAYAQGALNAETLLQGIGMITE